MLVGQELDNMTHKQFLRKLKKLKNLRSFSPEMLDNLSQERMESLEDHLDLDWIDNDPTECFDLG
jgi:hypothetical protein